MSSAKTRRVYLIAGACTLAVALAYCEYERHQVGQITTGYSRGWLSYVNVHASAEPWISIDGHRFKNVAGEPPYYLEVPGTDILFLIENRRPEPLNHFFDRKTRTDVAILGSTVELSMRQGFEHGGGAWVEEVKLPQVVVMGCLNAKDTYRYEFDLKKRTVDGGYLRPDGERRQRK
jgi:hypothetical protein